MSSVYKSYPLFNDIENVRLRAWNRCATFFSIHKDYGRDMAKSYVDQLDDIAKKQMTNMLAEIRERGYEVVKKSVVESYKLH